jgi:ribose transport system permease protein
MAASPAQQPVPETAVSPAARLARRVRGADPAAYVVYVGFVLILVFFAITLRDDGFLTSDNLLNILRQTAPITIMAVGMVFVLSAGEIDLSIGSVVALSALVTGVLLRDEGIVAAILGGLGVGLTVGLVNGLFVTRLRLPSFLVTLATMGLIAGLARTVTDLQSVPITDQTYIDWFGSGELFGLSSLIIWSLVVVGLGHLVLRKRRFGAHALATGDNEQAAQNSGIRTARVKIAVLMMSATAASFAGMLYAGRLEGARYTLGEADLMTVIAAVIIGGTRLFGGVGTVVGALIGSLIMGMLNNGLILMGLSVSEQMIARGVILLLAISLTLRERKS